MLERLSVLDASFLERDRPSTPQHTGGIGIFGPDLGYSEILGTLRARLSRIPLGRKRPLSTSSLGGRPVWVDDGDFDLSYHLRHAALPPPGDRGQLGQFLARLMARPLDRDRPLWEMYIVEGLEGGQVAVFRKVHLAMAGGDGGDPFAVLLDETPDGGQVQTHDGRWEPAPPPGMLSLAASAALDRADRVAAVWRQVGRLATSPGRLIDAATTAAGDAVGLLGRLAGSAPRSPLNFPLSSHRRIAMIRSELEDLRAVRRVFGGTINDVVVAMASDAVGRLLRWRGHDTKDLDLRLMVPIRVQGDSGEADQASGLGAAMTVGDGVVGVIAPLPVLRMDPVARLYRVIGEMEGLKESRQAVAADTLVRLAGFAPPNLHDAAARLVSGEQRYNVALSNAPGPQSPRYLAGVAIVETYPFLPLAGDSALSIAVTSYAGGVYMGLVGERDGMQDLDTLATFMTDALADLRDAADAASE
jgi:WS/DGAT/MGAT family acyltransferase